MTAAEPAVREATDATFEVLIATHRQPILVDFWAQWCGSCRMMAPMIEAIARDNLDRLLVAKVNIDASPDTAETYEVRSLPTLLVFAEGHVAKRISGAKSKSALLRDLADFL
jgi:thioredoxin 1